MPYQADRLARQRDGGCFGAAGVTPVFEIDPYRFTPSTISETLMNNYMREVYPAAVAAE